MIWSLAAGATRKREYESRDQLIRYWCCSPGFRTGLWAWIPGMLSKARTEIRNGNRRVPENAVEVACSWAKNLSPDKGFASWPIRRSAKGLTRFRPCQSVIITVAWHELATTVANKWNGNQMQIWLPFVFYTPSHGQMVCFGLVLPWIGFTAIFFWPIASNELSKVLIFSINAPNFMRRVIN